MVLSRVVNYIVDLLLYTMYILSVLKAPHSERHPKQAVVKKLLTNEYKSPPVRPMPQSNPRPHIFIG
jgi:hypothetical protein